MLWLVAALVCLASFPATVSAGNYEDIPIGSQAAMMGNAVTATVRDGAGGWYNPAGIAHAERQTLDVSVSVYGLRLVSMESMLRDTTGQSADASVTDWVLVPSAVAYTRRFGKLRMSFGIFIPSTSDFILRARLETEPGSPFVAVVQDLAGSYNYGLSFAWRLSERFRLGFTIFGTYNSNYSSFQLSGGQSGLNTNSIQLSEIFGVGNYGLKANVGFQWDIDAHWTVGMSLMTPGLTMFGFTDRTRVLSVTSNDGSSVYALEEEHTGLEWRWGILEPPTLRLGVAYHFVRNGVVEAGMSISTPLDGDEATQISTRHTPLDRDWVWNVHVGTTFDIAQAVALGFGFFTDRNPREGAGLDFYGFSFGFEFHSDYSTVEDRDISFYGMLGGRYAYGTGTGWGLQIGGFDDHESTSIIETRMVSHELSLNVGTGVDF